MKGKIIDCYTHDEDIVLKNIDTGDSYYPEIVPREGEYIKFRKQDPKYVKGQGYKITTDTYDVVSIHHIYGSETYFIVYVKQIDTEEEWFLPK